MAGPGALAPEMASAGPGDVAPGEAAIAGLVDVVTMAFVEPDFEAGLDLAAPLLTEPSPAAPVIAAPAPACTVAVTAAPAPAAMIDLTLLAPCAAGAALTLHHEGLVVRVAADAEGRATLRLPALATAAVILVEDPSGATAVATATIPDLALFERAVLQWQGPVGPELHAREFGAAYGEPGDVWSGAPGAALAGEGGFLVRLGEPGLAAPMMAEVYTVPAGAGPIDLTVEAQVSAATCGRDLLAQTIQVSPGAAPATVDVELPMPGCEADGEWLVLDQMLSDLAVAGL